MKSVIGKNITLALYGESHGGAIGVVVDGLPAGIKIDADFIQHQLDMRKPKGKISTQRKEADDFVITSGVFNGYTCGTPVHITIENKTQRSGDYQPNLPRPGHADYAAHVKYNGFEDYRGGGHFSGRLTAPIVAAGAILRLYLKENDIEIGGHILKIGEVSDTPFDPVNIDADTLIALSKSNFALLDSSAEEKMRNEVESARMDNDSIGGVVEIAVTGLPAGLGGPMFEGVENEIAKAVFGIPAVKGIEFGAGFGFAKMRGSEANDQMYYDGGAVRCYSNNNGGITGGLTNSMPIVFRVAIKPTPSIAKPQQTVDIKSGTNTEIVIKGRHDPCIVPRALPAIEAVTAIAVANLLSEVGD